VRFRLNYSSFDYVALSTRMLSKFGKTRFFEVMFNEVSFGKVRFVRHCVVWLGGWVTFM